MSVLLARFSVVTGLIIFGFGCSGEASKGNSADGAASASDANSVPLDAAFEPPRTDLVTAVGSDSTLDFATWNIENFPDKPGTPRIVADLIASLELDFVATEEIANIEAFNETLARLPHHTGILSSHTYSDGSYQKVGFIYRSDEFEISSPVLLFENMGFDFPRPPLQVRVSRRNHPEQKFIAIVLHLKAGVDDADRDRRARAVVALVQHVKTLDLPTVVLGDFNESPDWDTGRAVYAPIENANFNLLTLSAALAGQFSFIPSGRLIDQIVLAHSESPAVVNIPRLDDAPIDYQGSVSDHLPVIASWPLDGFAP